MPGHKSSKYKLKYYVNIDWFSSYISHVRNLAIICSVFCKCATELLLQNKHWGNLTWNHLIYLVIKYVLFPEGNGLNRKE